MKQRLDKELLRRGLAVSRSQAEDIIRRGFVTVKDAPVTKAGFLVDETTPIKIKSRASFVSRAGEKLYSVIEALDLDFKNKTVLDVGSSTGGFTDVVLRQSAAKVIAVDVGTDQMHPSLRQDGRIELHEKTDIRDFIKTRLDDDRQKDEFFEVVLIDVSFISLREILPHISQLLSHDSRLKTHDSLVVAMVKPQFEAGEGVKHKGVIKNDKMRRDILKSFEIWVQDLFIIVNKADSEVAGAKGNRERFYLLKPL